MIKQFFPDTGYAHNMFLGDPEDAGYFLTDNKKYKDYLGNTGSMRYYPFDCTNPIHMEVLLNWFCGDDQLDENLIDTFIVRAQKELGISFDAAYRAVHQLVVQRNQNPVY